MEHTRSPRSELGILLIARLTFDLDFQIIILFFSIFNESFHIETWFLGFLITIYSIFLLFSPIIGNLSDQYGRRGFITLGLLIFALSSVILAVAQNWIHVLLARALSGLSNAIFFPALLGELGDRYSYKERTRAMGIVRLAWPITFIFGVPLVGYSIEHLNWRLPYAIMAIVAFITGLTIMLKTSPKDKTKEGKPIIRLKLDLFKRVLLDRYAVAGLIMVFFAAAAIEGIITYFPTWVETQFQLGEADISMIYAFMGVGTLFGTLLATWIGDNLGPKQCAVIGLILASVCMLLLSHFSFNPMFVILWLFFLGLTFDFSMTVLPVLLTQLAPDAKGTIISLNISMIAGATALSAALSGLIWRYYGFSMIGLLFASTALIGAFIGLFLIKVVTNSVLEKSMNKAVIENF